RLFADRGSRSRVRARPRAAPLLAALVPAAAFAPALGQESRAVAARARVHADRVASRRRAPASRFLLCIVAVPQPTRAVAEAAVAPARRASRCVARARVDARRTAR